MLAVRVTISLKFTSSLTYVALLSFSAHSAGASVQVGVTELTILIHSTVHTVRTDRLTQRYSQTNPSN